MFPAPNAYTPLSWRQNAKIVSTVSKMIRLDGILLSNLERSLVREYKKYKKRLTTGQNLKIPIKVNHAKVSYIFLPNKNAKLIM